MAILDWIIKLFNAHQQQVLCYCCTTLNLISVQRWLRNCWSHRCMSQGLNMLSHTFLQITSWQPYCIESQNCLPYINNRCCVTAVSQLVWFQFKDGLEIVDHIGACPRLKYAVTYFSSNYVLAAILDQITKLFNAHQQQVLCYCCITLNLISLQKRLRNCWSHRCMSKA